MSEFFLINYVFCLHACRHRITRLVAVTSWCVQPGPNNDWFVEWILKPLFLNGVLKNMAVMEKMLEDSNPEEINYTIVRPCHLIEGMLLQLILSSISIIMHGVLRPEAATVVFFLLSFFTK